MFLNFLELWENKPEKKNQLLIHGLPTFLPQMKGKVELMPVIDK
jgi:hypothetical protein